MEGQTQKRGKRVERDMEGQTQKRGNRVERQMEEELLRYEREKRVVDK